MDITPLVNGAGGIAGIAAGLFTGAKWLLEWRRRRSLDPVPETELTETIRLRRLHDASQKRIDELYENIAKLSGQVERAVATAEALKARVSELERELAETTAECDALRDKLDAERTARASAEREREQMRATMSLAIQERDALEQNLAELKRARTEGTGRFRPQR